MTLNTDKLRSKLLERRQELLSISAGFIETLDDITLDEQILGNISRLDAMHHKAMAEEQERQRKFEIYRIEDALDRLSNDEYGYCEHCGEEISEKRLEVNPSARRCIKCAS